MEEVRAHMDEAGPAFTEFVLARSDTLFRTAVLLTRDPHTARDLVQEALLKAWRSWDRITGEDLADSATASLPRTGRTMDLLITSEGVGRVHVAVNGEPVTWAHAPGLRDGWWTAWTDQRVTSLVLGSLDHALVEGDVLEFRVDGYDPGEVRIETFTVAP